MNNPPRRLDVFEPVRKMPKTVLDAALVLGAPNPPQAAVIDAVELLDADGMARAPGCSLAEIRMSAGRLAAVVCQRKGTASAEDADRRATARINAVRVAARKAGGNGGSGPASRPARQRGQGRS